MTLTKYSSLHAFSKKALLIIIALSGIGFILWLDSWFMNHTDMPELSRDMSYSLLILVGFLSSFHCVGMCGPLILGYTAKNATKGHKSHSAHLLYGIGKTLSYSTIGALFGAFGAVVSFTPQTQGLVGVAAGAFLILFGLHMLEVFSALKHFQFKTPAFVMRFIGKEYRKHGNPFFIGLLNGLMIICGPLQAMYVMAAGTGNWAEGATLLFFFGLGTLPLLLGFGFMTSLLSKNLTPKLLKASGVIVMALGVIMFNRGLAVTGANLDFNTLTARLSHYLSPTVADTQVCEAEQTIHMNVDENGFSPNQFTLKKDIPVKWVIHGNNLNACNKVIVVPSYDLRIEVQPGEQIIEFTPNEAGVVSWSCWMGMIPGTFIVIDNKPSPESTQSDQPQELATTETVGEKLFNRFKLTWKKLWQKIQQRISEILG